jgi:DNA-binding transcriptional ArsR family regulator
MAARSGGRGSATQIAPAAPRVRDFSGGLGGGLRVDYDARTVYDFVFSLSDDVGTTEDLPAVDRRWLAGAREEMRALFGETFEMYGATLCIMLAGLAVDRPEVSTAARFVDLVTDLDDGTIVRMVVGEDLRDPERGPLVERALAGDDEAIEQLVRRFEEQDAGMDAHKERAKIVAALYRRPEVILGPARGILAAWLDHFTGIEDRVRRMIERDVELRAEDRRTLAPADLIEKTTGGVRFSADPVVRRVIMAPSYFSRPYNFLLAADDWRLFGYPIADAALDASDPLAPPATVVRFHRALGDETRLRILRLLREKDLYLTEIAQLLELSKPTIKHHLALLRVAGVVTVTEEAGLTYYSLRRDRLEDAAGELRRFLLD